MPRASNPTSRAVGILDLLASRPEELFGLSEIARLLKMNKATCLNVLGALSAAGYVLQDDATKCYTLGPAVVALGNAALGRFPAMAPAREVARSLSDELGLTCLVVATAANHIVVLDSCGHVNPSVPSFARVGQRAPFAPPLGVPLIAWSTAAQYAQWLGRANPPLSAEEHELQRSLVNTVRARGYIATRQTEGHTRVDELLQDDAKNPYRAVSAVDEAISITARGDPHASALIDIAPDAVYRLSTVSAPVFGPHGRAVLALVVEGFSSGTTGADLQKLGDRVLRAARRVSDAIGGRHPAFRQ